MKRFATLPSHSIELPGVQTPPNVQTFLQGRGWYANGSEGWMKHGGDAMTWEQALAIEFMNFITLGGPHGLSR